MDFDLNNNDQLNLKTTDLSLMAHGIRNIDEIPLHKNLLSINLHSNEIERINGLTGLNYLTHLDLSSNNIIRIQGLEGLVSLDTLNLASNKIVVVEGLFALKKLSWLNLSYNKIEYLQGFQDLWGPEYNLAIIQIHGNQIDSLDDIVKNLNGLSRLQHLTFRENPIAKKDAYRVTLFNRLRTLISLDGMDKHGKKDMNSQGLTGIEQYVGLTNDTREQLHDVTNSISHQYPKIAAALNALRHNPKPMESSTTTSVDIQNGSLSAVESECVPRSTKPTTRRPVNHDKRSARSPSTDNESDSMPIKTSRLKPRSTASNAVVQSTPRQQPTTTKKLSTKTHMTLNNSSSPPPPSNLQTKSHSMIDENTRPFSINSHQHLYNTTCEHDCDEYHYRSNRDNENDDMNEIYRATLHDLDNERDKRWRAEQEIKHLNDIINEFKNRPNDDRTNESIVQELTEKHKQRLVDEKSKFQDLTTILDDYKARLRSTEDQLSSYKKAHETNLQLIKTLESNLSKLESDKSEIRITENEKNRNWERRSNALQNEKEILQQELKTTKQQLRECQELYTTREIQHKQELEKCRIDLQATEVQQYLKQEIQRREDIHRTELTHQQEKLQSLAVEYKKLEDEFRDALKIEERRYQELFKTNEIIQKENELLQSSSTNIKQREESDRKMVNDLMVLVREQKQRLQERTKTNDNLTHQNKHLTTKLERAIDELKKIREQILILQKERREIDARLIAQESILSGLREEKKLWSHELAHQGASLAQDRGRLESTIQTLTSEVNTLKKQLDKEVDTCRIKQTIIESQLDTIQKLKDGVVERDDTIKKAREDLLLRHKELEQQLQDEQLLYQELQEKYEKVCEKRDSIKNDMHQMQQQLEKSKNDYNALSRKWKEKSDLITELDNKIRRASENYQTNEKKLIDENNRLIEAQKQTEDKLRQRDDDFRRQFETIEHGHRQTLNQMQKNYEEKLQQAQIRINEVEDEMRILLHDTNQRKKKWEERMKHLRIFKQQQNNIWRLCSPSLLRSTSVISSSNIIRTLTNQQNNQNERSLLSARLPVILNQPYRTRKLKFSFGYTNYGHRRHIRPPGHHIVHYMHFFLIIIGAYAVFYLTNVTEFEDRWIQPMSTTQAAERNTFINPKETQRRLDVFSNVKAATILPAVEANSNDSNEENDEKNLSEVTRKVEKSKKEAKNKLSFRDKKKIAYENRLRAFSTPDKIFRYFATLKVSNDDNPDGIICMTPDDFLRSITPGLKQPDGLELDKFYRYDARVDPPEKLDQRNSYLYSSALNSDEQSIFELIGGKQCLITFSDYIFLVTLLSTPRRYFQIAFQMFDFDGNGNFDFDEFAKLKNLIREQTSIGQRHRDHSTTGNILRETSIVNHYFFGENLDQLLTVEKFLHFYEQLQKEILQLEFHRSAKCPNDKTRMRELDFATSLLAYSGLSDKRVKKMLKRIKKAYPVEKSVGISFNDYKNFYSFLRNIHDIDVALTFYHIAGGAIDKQIFRHVAKTVNHIDLDSHLVDVVFTIFDDDEDQLLSYVEFIHIMKNRLERGLQRPKDTAFMKLFSTMITCAKETYL
ncbi:unnamed protein product [Adineta steineri]|uniref:EF-hand domain-containing protein n=1 Tax=Adineta steineri TaxID=433720 RepID=A0A815PCS0_9BILA|nr:unnamed protein product [Adineta steineri]